MKLKFKDGTVIEVSETEDKSKEEIIAEAKEVYKDFRDSQKQEVEVKDSIDNGDYYVLECKNGLVKYNDKLVLFETEADALNYAELNNLEEPIAYFADEEDKQQGIPQKDIIQDSCANGDCVEDTKENVEIKDVDPETINKLIKEEEDAVKSYENAIQIAKEANDEPAIARYQHIIEEEMEHIQELKDLLANDVHDSNEVEDSQQVQDEPAHITFGELKEIFDKHNSENNVKHQFEDPNPLYGVIVFSNENAKNGQWREEYPLESRSYRFSSANKYFIPGMIGNSIFGECLDESERINLIEYIHEWVIEYCYIENM